jgi:hypothetical protein
LLAAQRNGGSDRGRGGRCDDPDELLTIHSGDAHNSIVRLDIMRLPLGILSGVGFIGAGAILRRGDTVRGVTTAATIWLVTVIGRCFGGGQLGLGAAATVIGVAALWGIDRGVPATDQYITARSGVVFAAASPCGNAEISGSGTEPHMHTA